MKKKLKEELRELRRKKERGDKLTRGENFRLLCQDVMNRYEKNGKWSSLELEFKELLESLNLKEKEDYLHNFKVQNESQSGYYSLDFFFPKVSLVIEISPSIWHKIGNSPAKDARRKKWIEKLGWKVVEGENLKKLLEIVKEQYGI